MADRRTKTSKNRKQHKHSLGNSGFLLTESSPFALSEAFVKLRTNLMFSLCADGEHPCRVFAFTSPSPAEGKSTTVANIAISFARLGKKTILIDADMRKPTQWKKWRIPSTHGLSDLLAKIDSCSIYKASEFPLSIITAGDCPPNPSELLASANMQHLVEYVKSQYEYVLIDTPPINTVADAQIISKFVDGTVLVVRSEQTKRAEMQYALEQLEQAGANVCGVVLNDLNIKSSKYGYKSAYSSYSYGYSKEYSNKK